MFKALHALWMGLHLLRALPHMLVLSLSDQKPTILADLERWLEEDKRRYKSQMVNLGLILWRYPEFRSLFYHRINRSRASGITVALLGCLLRPMYGLYIATEDIGPGLFIQHGLSTGMAADRIGKNCWINHEVTIGHSKRGGRPTLGDNVIVNAGAKVIGPVTIGDNSVVGANAVVVKNVPPNCTVVGVPAYIVRRDGRKVREDLV